MKSVFKTDRGQVREHNEDNGAVLLKETAVLALVVDGMGGHKAGDVASALALEAVSSRWNDLLNIEDPDKVVEWLGQTVADANQYVYHHASANEECKGMGTTLVAAFCQPNKAVVANVGDSRCYLLKKEGQLEQITEDHSLVNELVKAGQLSKEDADYHPKKNVLTKALGTAPKTDYDVHQINWTVGDKLLLCSDGLTNMVSHESLESILKEPLDLEKIADKLVWEANNAGGHDNITLAIVQYDEAGDGEAL